MTTPTPISTAKGYASSIRPVKDSSKSHIVELILGAALFQDMDPKDVSILAQYLSLYQVDQGTVIFHEGDVGEFMGLIVDGIVELIKENPSEQAVKIASEGSGRLVGEMALVDGEPRSATARFTQPGQVLILTRESFQSLLHHQPRAAAHFLFRLSRLLSQRLRRTTGLLTTYLK